METASTRAIRVWNSPRARPLYVSGSSDGRRRQRRTSRKIREGLLPGLQAPRDDWERGGDGGDEKHGHVRRGVEEVEANQGEKGARYDRRGVCEVRV